MLAYPGLPEREFGMFLTHAASLVRGQYAPGTGFEIATCGMPGNTGTYLFFRGATSCRPRRDVRCARPFLNLTADGPSKNLCAAVREKPEQRKA
jgi:hypothetical protein